MKISKKDALKWFEFLASLENKDISSKYEIIIVSTFSQIEDAIE